MKQDLKELDERVSELVDDDSDLAVYLIGELKKTTAVLFQGKPISELQS